ncbi:MAG: T9SS type A sorting domain-containing protein, partial [Calditrichota bacterium]
REGAREVMFNVSGLTGDRDIEAAIWTQNGYYIAGGNSGRDPNKIYCLDSDFNLRRQYDQPGGVNGDGFLDLAGDGSEVIYAGDAEQIVEFTTNGELGEQLEGPGSVDVYRAVGINYNREEGGLEFFLGGNEGYIVRTDAGLWEQERIEVGDTVRTLAVKPNDRALYIVTAPRPGFFVLSLVTLEDGKIRPLYPLMPPAPEAVIGGIEVTQDWRSDRGSLVGVWKRPNGDDWVFVIDLYPTWLIVYPEWTLLMPGERAEWMVQFAGDQVDGIGRYQSEMYLAVNGFGEDGRITAMMRVTPAEADQRGDTKPQDFRLISAYPNPFNGRVRLGFNIRVPGPVLFSVLNAAGDMVARHSQLGLSAGTNNWTWDAANTPSGAYVITIQQADGAIVTRPVVQVK